MFTKAFLGAALERAIRGAAASLASLLVAGGTGIIDTDWADKLSVSGMAGLVSLLLSIAAVAVSPDSGPSFGTETPTGNVVALTDSKTGNAVAGPALAGVSNGTPVDVDTA